MIGNAVPVKLAEFVANGILEYISNNHIEQLGQLDIFDSHESFIMPNKALHFTA